MHRHRAAGGELYHVTLTVRHGLGQDLRGLRTQLAKAWRSCIGGAPWKRLAARIRWAGTVRALEVTYGANGWHPHLHILILTDGPRGGRELVELRRHLFARWVRALARTAPPGVPFTPPTRRRGIKVVRATVAEYLAATPGLSDELAGGAMKRAKGTNRTPWQLLADVARGKYADPGERAADLARWRAWGQDMGGARQLTWSRGLRKRYRVDQGDEQLELPLALRPQRRLWIRADEWQRVRAWPALDAKLRELAEDFELTADTAQEIADDWLERTRAGPEMRGAA